MSANLVKLAMKCFHVFIFEDKRRTGYDINIAKQNLFSGAISHGASKAPKEHLEPSKTSVKVSCCGNCKQLKKAVNYFCKKKNHCC